MIRKKSVLRKSKLAGKKDKSKGALSAMAGSLTDDPAGWFNHSNSVGGAAMQANTTQT